MSDCHITKKRRKRLDVIYSIKNVSGYVYRDGFYTGLDFFDEKIRKFLKRKGLYQEFMNFLAEEQQGVKPNSSQY